VGVRIEAGRGEVVMGTTECRRRWWKGKGDDEE